MLAFVLSGTCIVDTSISSNSWISQIDQTKLVKFLHTLTLQKLKGEAGNATLSENFQECVEVDIFGVKATVVHNDVLAVASLNTEMHDVLFTRYVFLQFWGLFTRQIMTDFMESD